MFEQKASKRWTNGNQFGCGIFLSFFSQIKIFEFFKLCQNKFWNFKHFFFLRKTSEWNIYEVLLEIGDLKKKL